MKMRKRENHVKQKDDRTESVAVRKLRWTQALKSFLQSRGCSKEWKKNYKNETNEIIDVKLEKKKEVRLNRTIVKWSA
jgi:hypothetical protein